MKLNRNDIENHIIIPNTSDVTTKGEGSELKNVGNETSGGTRFISLNKKVSKKLTMWYFLYLKLKVYDWCTPVIVIYIYIYNMYILHCVSCTGTGIIALISW